MPVTRTQTLYRVWQTSFSPIPFLVSIIHQCCWLIHPSSIQMRRLHSHPYHRQDLSISVYPVRKSPSIFFLPTYRYIQDMMEDSAQVTQHKPEVNHSCLSFSWTFSNPHFSSCPLMLPPFTLPCAACSYWWFYCWRGSYMHDYVHSVSIGVVRFHIPSGITATYLPLS